MNNPTQAEALLEIAGCFSAATTQGLMEALAETKDDRLRDLVERRLLPAHSAALSALAAPVEQAPLTTPNTMAGFKGGFYVEHRRQPTEQEIWNAGVRSGIDRTVPQAHTVAVPEWQPMETAPKDGTLLRLLVKFDDNATEDSTEPCPTIGANSGDHTGEDRWEFAGWSWTHDCFSSGAGTPVGWLPMLAAAPSHEAAQETQEPVAEVVSYHTAGLYDELPLGTKLYAAPAVSAVPALTDEQILALAVKSGFTEGGTTCWGTEFVAFARAILASHSQISGTAETPLLAADDKPLNQDVRATVDSAEPKGRKLLEYGECKYILSQYCDGTCNPIFEDAAQSTVAPIKEGDKP